MNTKAHQEMQSLSTELLAAIARGEIDAIALAKAELVSRGLDLNGQWVGFKAAKEATEAK